MQDKVSPCASSSQSPTNRFALNSPPLTFPTSRIAAILTSARIACLALFALLASIPSLGQSNESIVTLTGHVPVRVLNGEATLVGHYESTQKLRLTLAVAVPHMSEEEEFLRELTDRSSPNFHQFLTAEEWNARFGPTPESEQAVVDWAVSQGFTVTHRFDHRLLVDVEAPVALIEKAFGVTINNYQFDDEVVFSNDRDPVLPAHLQGIVYSVQGLNNIERMHGSRPGSDIKGTDYAEGPAFSQGMQDHADAITPGSPVADVATSDDVNVSNYAIFDSNGSVSPGGVFNSQIYNYDGLQHLGHCCNPHNDSGGAPNVSDIAIAAFGNYNASDIKGFQAAFPYLAYNYSTWYIDGNIDCTSNPGACPSGETTQDLEWTIATANSFSSSNTTGKVIVYIGANGNNSTFTDMYGYMLSDNSARVFTTSWSCTEVYGCSTGTMDSRHNIFNNMLGQGWTLIAASGDRGTADDCNFEGPQFGNSAHESVAYPGSDYDVLAAGGTQLQMYSNGTWDYEHGWQGGFSAGSCKGNGGGSGGGVSSYYSQPGWQSGSAFIGAHRNSPDLSLNALGIGQSIYISGKLTCCANGTSIVAPELAGFFAQENAYLNYIGHICGAAGNLSCTPIGNPMPYMYHVGYNLNNTHVSHNPYYDMTGNYCNNNDVTVADGLGYYCDTAGYDRVTGWGTANMLQLAWGINWYLIPANGVPNVSFTGPATNKWYNNGQIVSWKVNDYGGPTFPGTGIAGFTQGWDSITPDSFSKPHGGTGDSYWSGPYYANATNGCISLVSGAGGCAGGVSQGCHTAHVRGWNNQGWTTGDKTYGPICYDNVAPKTTSSLQGTKSSDGWYQGSVKVTLAATDTGSTSGTGSGVEHIFYAVNTPTCKPGATATCKTYSSQLTVATSGALDFTYFSEDNAGNFDSLHSLTLDVDSSAPTTTASHSPTTTAYGWNNSAVKVTLTPTDPTGPGIKETFYAVNSSTCTTTATATCTKYTGPISFAANNGKSSVTFFSEDDSGNFEIAKSVPVDIDTIPPVSKITVTGAKSGSGYIGKITISFTATDNLSGVAELLYQVNNGAVTKYTGPISGTFNGTVTIKYASTDKAGNHETEHTITITDKD